MESFIVGLGTVQTLKAY